jgi:hypothetical protein
MNAAGVRKAIIRKVQNNQGYLKVPRNMIFTKLGLDGCDWGLLKRTMQDLNEGNKVTVEEEGSHFVFKATSAAKRLVAPTAWCLEAHAVFNATMSICLTCKKQKKNGVRC